MTKSPRIQTTISLLAVVLALSGCKPAPPPAPSAEKPAAVPGAASAKAPEAGPQGDKPLLSENFEKTEEGKLPDDFLVLDGSFAVKAEGGNKFLELPGAPLDTFGVLFGPTEPDGLCVTARIFGTGKGRRFPALAVGVNGVGGYRLQVSASKKQVELYKGDEVKVSVPYEWQSGVWTTLRLQLRKLKDGEWKVEGKAWPQTGKEPEKWLVTLDEKEAPPPGRPSIWGNPFSGTPIQFDDLVVTKAK